MLQGLVPEQLKNKRLFSLNMASVLAGTKYRGEFEERVRISCRRFTAPTM